MDTRGKRPARPVVDLTDFVRLGQPLAGTLAPAQLPRLRELLVDDAGDLAWRLQGERRARPEGGSDAYLSLHLEGHVTVQCIRCLRGVEAALAEERLFKVLATESQAERFDAESDECDALVASPRFDVLELVEDEAILALPIAPRHDDCALPEEAGREAPGAAPAEDAPRPNPFAALAALKRPGGGGHEG